MSTDTGRELLRVRAAWLLTGGVAVLSLATGVANISVAEATGPLGDFIPLWLQRTAGFTGALTGFLLLSSAWGLRRGYKLFWVSAVALVPVAAIQGLVQASLFSYPLVVLSVLTLPALGLNRHRFRRELDFSTTQKAAVLALVGVLGYATAGAYALREDFVGVTTLTDALYYAIVTAATVGYGDATPLGPEARLFGISVVVLGTVSFAIALGSVLGPAIEARFARALGTMSDQQYELLEDHIVVLGYGDLTEPLLEELEGTNEFVVVVEESEYVTALRSRDINVLAADPSDEEPLRAAGIVHARAAIAATNDDANDALSILTARSLNPDLRIVAAATLRENVEKLRRAGADAVISPAVIGGHLLAESARGESDTEALVDRILGTQ